jgi:chromosome partitioning protein
MAKVLSVLQQKGGVGKTTIAVHLATQIKETFPKLRVALADADPQQSATIWIRKGNGKAGVAVYPVAGDGEGEYLRRELSEIDADLIILDLPPAIASVSSRAALYSDLMLVPTGASALDIEAAKSAIAVCQEAILLDSNKQYLLVPNRVQLNTAAGRELRSVLKNFGPVSETTLCLRIAFADSVMHGVGINMFAHDSLAYQEIGELANEVMNILGLKGGI